MNTRIENMEYEANYIKENGYLVCVYIKTHTTSDCEYYGACKKCFKNNKVNTNEV